MVLQSSAVLAMRVCFAGGGWPVAKRWATQCASFEEAMVNSWLGLRSCVAAFLVFAQRVFLVPGLQVLKAEVHRRPYWECRGCLGSDIWCLRPAIVAWPV